MQKLKQVHAQIISRIDGKVCNYVCEQVLEQVVPFPFDLGSQVSLFQVNNQVGGVRASVLGQIDILPPSSLDF